VACLLAAFAVVAGGVLVAPRSSQGPSGGPTDRSPGAGGGRGGPAREGQLVVVASIFPLADIIAVLGGEAVTVETLLPAGASPHTFEINPVQALLVADAGLVVRIGGGLDPFVDSLTAVASPSAARLELMSAVPQGLLAADSSGAPAVSGPDPHIWLDPVLVRDRLLPALTGALCALRPALAADFAARGAAYAQELTALDAWIRERLEGLEHKGLITVHRGWDYFGARYGLKTWAVEQQPGQEPSPRHVMDLLAVAIERDIRTLFVEPQVAGHAAEALVLEIGGQVLALDPLGGPGMAGYGSYLEMMRSNVSVIEAGLR